MKLTRVHPEYSSVFDAGTAEAHALLTQWYCPPQKEWLRINMIQSINGSAHGRTQHSDSLTNATDRMLLKIIRTHADLVLVGAETVRAEGWVFSGAKKVAVITRTGHFGAENIPEESRENVLVIAPQSRHDSVTKVLGKLVDVMTVEDKNGTISAQSLLAELRNRGFHSIVCEGGSTVNGHLISAEQIDEICLSFSSCLSSSEIRAFSGVDRELTLEQLMIAEDSSLYSLWRVPRSAL